MDPQQADQIAQAAQSIPVAAAAVQPIALELIILAKAAILPIMFIAFFAAVALRSLIYYTIKREDTFAREFEKRVNRLLDSDSPSGERSYFVLCKRVLELTYYEMFEVRGFMKRRNLDYVMAPSDRIFLVQPGTAILVRDILREIKFLRYDNNRPPLLDIAKSVFANNPCFNRIVGWIPVPPLNDFLNVIPGLFIVGGIFGTFLGIMQALPELGAMDIRDPESTKLVMDTFLAKIAFSMSTSTVGIFLSVLSTVFNNFLSPERLFTQVVDRFERNMSRLWNRSTDNRLPADIPHFDEHRDPLEALASLALEKELGAAKKWEKDRQNPVDAAQVGTPPPPPSSKKAA